MSNNNNNNNNISENSNNDDIQIEINKTPKLYLTKKTDFQKCDNLNQLNIFLENDFKKINSIFSSIKNILQSKQKLSQNNIESLLFILKYIENCNFFFFRRNYKKFN